MELRFEIIGHILVLSFLLFLRVCGLQQFTERPQDLSIVMGRTATLKCAVENKVGSIQWGKGAVNPIMLGFERQIPGYDGRYSIIGTDPSHYNLQIVNTNLDDDDDFQCQVGPADNNPPLVATAHLTVLVPPNFPEIEGYTNGSVVEVAYTESVLFLVCVSKAGRPAATLTWFRNDVEITEGVEYEKTEKPNDKREDAKSTLRLTPTYPDDNNVRYTCQANNNALSNGPYRITVFLSVLYPPSQPVITGYEDQPIIRVNDTVRLMCTSEAGNPLAQIAWFRQNAQVDFSYSQRDNRAENELVIKAERSDNDAEYRCEAWNSVNLEKPLFVTRKLVVYFAPKTATITGTREAKAGETLTLTCTTSNSNPAAEISWIPFNGGNFRNKTEKSPNGGYITTSEIDITLNDQQTTNAIYICSATNTKLGITVADTASVGVLYPPEPPTISGYVEGTSIKAGDIVKLKCQALRGNPPATLKWFKGDDEITDFTDLSAGNVPTLQITIQTTANDNGALYKCQATNRATDSPLETFKKLTVHFPPASLTISSDPVIGRAGHRLRLTCTSASSNPAAEITWIHNSRKLTGTNIGLTSGVNGGKISKNQLEIIPTSADHEASYGCAATNLVLERTLHDAIILNVLFKPEFRDKETMVPITAGESRILNLTAAANPSNGTYVLKRGDVVINPGDIGSFSLDIGVLTISAITKEDAAAYTIVCTNTEGSTSFHFTLDVLYPAEIYESNPVTTDAGSTVELKCLVRGNPLVPDMVTWKRDGFDMTRALSSYQNGVGTLIIENVQKADTGYFTCIAQNSIGSATEMAVKLTVEFVPEIDKAPKYSKAASEVGLTGRLVCRAQGTPTVSFRWEKDGVNIVSDGIKYMIEEDIGQYTINYESILSIKNVVKKDYGIYQCIVTNGKGEDRLLIDFDDKRKPDPPDGIEFVNATHNSITIKWNPGFDGGEEQYYRVRYKPVVTSQGYVQVDVQPKDSTVYTVKGLALGTEYELTVMAYNTLGGSGYSPEVITAKTSNLKPTTDVKKEEDKSEDISVIIVLILCVAGIFLLALNIGLILFCVRRRKKRMENGSDTTSHTNTIELYGPNKETQLYPMTPSDESRSYGTYDKNEDDFSDDYKSYEDEDLKRVFLPPPEYGGVTYSHNKLDSPTFDHRHPVHTEPKYAYAPSETDSCRKSPFVTYEDPYKSNYRGKGTFDSDYPDRGKDYTGPLYEPNGHAGGSRPKSITELSERSSRPSSRGGHKTPPPPPVRSSSKGAADIPPLPARNYESQEVQPRYVPPPGSSSSYGNNINVIANPHYDGPSIRTPSPRQPADPTDDMRGYLV